MPDASLLDLVEAIRARDTQAALAILKANPALAKAAFPNNGKFKFPVGAYYYVGDTALHFAANAYDAKVAGQLIADGADVRARNRRGHEPLHLAASGLPGEPGWNPTAQARMINLLIDAGADPNATSSGEMTPLHRAVRCRGAAAAEALLDRGATVLARNKSGSTAWDLTRHTTGRGGSGSPQARAQQALIVDLLTRRGGAA